MVHPVIKSVTLVNLSNLFQETFLGYCIPRVSSTHLIFDSDYW
jgi:hypothetical protein